MAGHGYNPRLKHEDSEFQVSLSNTVKGYLKNKNKSNVGIVKSSCFRNNYIDLIETHGQ